MLHSVSSAPVNSVPKEANSNSYSHMQVDVLKRRGGWAVDNIDLQLVGDDPIRRLQDIQQQLSLWKATTSKATTSKTATSKATTIEPVKAAQPLRHTEYLTKYAVEQGQALH